MHLTNLANWPRARALVANLRVGRARRDLLRAGAAAKATTSGKRQAASASGRSAAEHKTSERATIWLGQLRVSLARLDADIARRLAWRRAASSSTR